MDVTLARWEFSILMSEQLPKTNAGHYFDPALPALSARLTFTGRTRELPSEQVRFLELFGRSTVALNHLAGLYRHEIEVEEAGLRYWLAVEKDVFPRVAHAIKPNDELRAYFRFIGVAPGRHAVYLMTSFERAAAN